MRRRLAVLVWLFLSAAVLAGVPAALARTSNPLRSFYVARFFFSDDISSWNHTILDVTPAGDDVRIRLIQMSLAYRSCSTMLVRAVERVLPHTTVAAVAGTNICASTERSIRSAVAKARRSAIHTETASQFIDAKCGTEERVFDFPFDVDLDQEKLQRSSPAAASLQNLIYRVRDDTFGKSFWFDDRAAEEQRRFEALGASLVPELMSAKYAAAFDGWTCFDQPKQKCVPNYLAWRLKGYRIVPPNERGPRLELLEQASLHLTQYSRPTYPSIAESARVQGDVQLRITADARTGAAVTVDVVSGPLLLSAAAADAAKAWRFDPAFLNGLPIIATLRFSLDC